MARELTVVTAVVAWRLERRLATVVVEVASWGMSAARRV
jgi:hypothetical protein